MQTKGFLLYCLLALILICGLGYIIHKLDTLTEKVDVFEPCCEKEFPLLNQLCNENFETYQIDTLVTSKKESVQDGKARIFNNHLDSVYKSQPYYCNQVVVIFKPGYNYDESVDFLEDTLGLDRVKKCPNCDSLKVELWGKDGDIPISPEEGAQVAEQDAEELNDGMSITFNYKIELPIGSLNPKITREDKGSITSNTNSVKIAIIDSGIDFHEHNQLDLIKWTNNEELNNQFDDDNNCIINDTTGYDFVNNSTFVDDIDGHGTHIAGIIAQTATSIQGYSPQLMDLKVLHAGEGSLFDIVCAINYAITKKANIINLSLGFYSEHNPWVLDYILEKAEEEGILVVASAGNDNYDNFAIINKHYPSEIGTTISVAALRKNIQHLWSGSNYGASKVDLAVPGVDIISTYHNGYFAELTGTSMAAGFVSGYAAGISSSNFNHTQIKQCIENDAQAQSIFSSKTVGPYSGRCANIFIIPQTPQCPQ